MTTFVIGCLVGGILVMTGYVWKMSEAKRNGHINLFGEDYRVMK